MDKLLSMNFADAKPWIDTLAVGARTWHRGRPCRVLHVDRDSYAEPMVVVTFDGSDVAILKPSELGKTADNVNRKG